MKIRSLIVYSFLVALVTLAFGCSRGGTVQDYRCSANGRTDLEKVMQEVEKVLPWISDGQIYWECTWLTSGDAYAYYASSRPQDVSRDALLKQDGCSLAGGEEGPLDVICEWDGIKFVAPMDDNNGDNRFVIWVTRD